MFKLYNHTEAIGKRILKFVISLYLTFLPQSVHAVRKYTFKAPDDSENAK
jgi:hypothetical protein